MQGWIKLHRKIVNHWVYEKPEYLHAWITILMTVNHEDKKSLIYGEVIECKRGQSLLSLYSWAKLFGRKWSIQKVRTFFDLLKSDAMINTEGLRKTTRLTVCNYDNYQDIQQTNNRQITFKQQTGNRQVTTTKECKNEKNEKNKDLFDEFRKKYPGIKRGLDTEYNNFVKKHKDWQEIIPILHEALEQQIKYRQIQQSKRQFVPEWKNMQTWINQRCWEEEVILPQQKSRLQL